MEAIQLPEKIGDIFFSSLHIFFSFFYIGIPVPTWLSDARIFLLSPYTLESLAKSAVPGFWVCPLSLLLLYHN